MHANETSRDDVVGLTEARGEEGVSRRTNSRRITYQLICSTAHSEFARSEQERVTERGKWEVGPAQSFIQSESPLFVGWNFN